MHETSGSNPDRSIMDLIKYIRERDFELRIGLGFVAYVDSDGEVTIKCTEDGGGRFSGEDTSFERLYRLLERRPDLRVTVYTREISIDSDKLDEYTSEREAISLVKIAQISDWLGLTSPYRF